MRVRTGAVIGLLFLLAAQAVVAGPAAAGATSAGELRLELTAPQSIGTGLTEDVTVTAINTTDSQQDFSLRVSFRPVAGGAVRPLEELLTIKANTTKLTPVKTGDAVTATTNSMAVAAHSTRTLSMTILVVASSTGRIPTSSVTMTVDALDLSDEVIAAGPTRGLTVLEPVTKLTGWPAQLRSGQPYVVATTTTNTTPFTYTFVSPSLALIRAGNEAVTVEVKNGQQWEPVSLYRNYFWRYALQYVTLAPGGSYTAQLRVTFGEDVQTATPSWVYQGMSTLFGGYLALDVQPYTQVPRG